MFLLICALSIQLTSCKMDMLLLVFSQERNVLKQRSLWIQFPFEAIQYNTTLLFNENNNERKKTTEMCNVEMKMKKKKQLCMHWTDHGMALRKWANLIYVKERTNERTNRINQRINGSMHWSGKQYVSTLVLTGRIK